MRVSIFGTGYVGLVTGTCLSHSGHQIICVDVDADKVARLEKGDIPIFEPGLDGMVSQSVKEGRLSFTTDAKRAIDFAEIIFIAVGTPPDEDGAADLKYVLQVAQSIGEHMGEYRLVINKSTVPVGSADKVKARIQEAQKRRGVKVEFDVASNPEFLKEGAALADFMKPDRIIIGTDSARVKELMHELYAPFNRNHDKLKFMDVRSAELTKYAANAMLATKISFMNELSCIAEKLGADIELVRKGIGSDPRIGYSFIYPGCGYGGSCFPKDVKALVRTANSIDESAELLSAVEKVNNEQKTLLFRKAKEHFNGKWSGITVALWGLAFKPNTDDMREAPSRVLMESLWNSGVKVQAYDPEAMSETQRIYPSEVEKGLLTLCDEQYSALKDADALFICTEWSAFRSPNWSRVEDLLKNKLVFDGRNLYDPERMKVRGFTYYSIGRTMKGTLNESQ